MNVSVVDGPHLAHVDASLAGSLVRAVLKTEVGIPSLADLFLREVPLVAM